MNVIAIVQVIMGSTRLPRKVLKKIRDRSVLDYVIERLKFCEKINDIVLATTTAKKDNALEEYAVSKGVSYFRGAEQEVLSRYYKAAKKYNADVVVRITSDCPLIDSRVVDKAIRKHIENKVDYTTNTIKRTYPRGLDVEVFNFDVLEDSYKNADEKYQREHVTPYIKEHPEKFKLQNIEAKGKLKRPDIRITVDTKKDFELIEKIILHFDNLNFKAKSIIDVLDEDPELLKINKYVKQEELKE